MSKTVLHLAETRGYANHGWLKSHHTFSFAEYQNQERVHFGALRVLNDDEVKGGMGFNEHPHDNMEIISIPLEGELKHQDSMGNSATIKSGEIQVMSAGTGVYHSEFNPNHHKAVKFLQIWIFPNQRNVTPRYDQIEINRETRNKLIQILSPNPNDEGVWIHQNAWFNIAKFDTGHQHTYELHNKENGVYIFVLKGNIEVDGQALGHRDGFGVWETEQVNFKASADAEFLVMEVPMNF